MSKKTTIKEFIDAAQKIHGTKYDYSLVQFKDNKSNISIICPIHGVFTQRLSNHLHNHGCLACAKIQNTDHFIIKAKSIHGDKYDYCDSVYINCLTPVKIYCKEHGEFMQKPPVHLSGKSGCPVCKYPKGEKIIHDYLLDNNIVFHTQFRLIKELIPEYTKNMDIDFFVKHMDKQYFIEYDGEQHFVYKKHFHKKGYEDFQKQQERDNALNNFCELYKDKVTLIRFKYTQMKEDIIDLLNSIFVN